MIKIGIPRALAYFSYGKLWSDFFKHLGCEVLLSPSTNKAMIDGGTRETVGEACIPIKVFHGHVMWLQGKVDYIFVPRLINVDQECSITFCPKFLGLPDLIKVSIPGNVKILSPDVKLAGSIYNLMKLSMELAQQVGKSKSSGITAMSKALIAKQNSSNITLNGVATFGIVGYPYFLHDEFLNFKLNNILNKNNVTGLLSDSLNDNDIFKYRKRLSKSLFWEFSNRKLLATYYFLDELKVDGLIHITAFACGPDAIVGKMIELECKERHIPFLELTIDEHTGEAGLKTRVEAFIDMFSLRRKGA